jgi:hypothetical protein
VSTDMASERQMPMLETAEGGQLLTYGCLGLLTMDALVDLANGVWTKRACALDDLMRAQGAGLRNAFNSDARCRRRIGSCDVYRFPGYTVTEHRLFRGPCETKPREGRILALWMGGRFLLYVPRDPAIRGGPF